MKKHRILYNPLSNGADLENAKNVESKFSEGDEFIYDDVTKISDYNEYFSALGEDEDAVLLGGDGTLNHAANIFAGLEIKTDLYYIPMGTGNDFFTDVAKEGEEMVKLNRYFENLPTVTVNGKTSKFVNGVGFGIDGYCCEEGDKQRENGVEKINYASIAIKGLLFHFKKRNAKINVDGKEYEFKNIWLAPTMIGRYYGGGMKVAPDQDRLNENKELTLILLHTKTKLSGLIVFPGLFSGKHVENKKATTVFTGKKITVTFDRPTPLQIDGETVPNVISYTANAAE